MILAPSAVIRPGLLAGSTPGRRSWGRPEGFRIGSDKLRQHLTQLLGTVVILSIQFLQCLEIDVAQRLVRPAIPPCTDPAV
jgi:hypothetical protein